MVAFYAKKEMFMVEHKVEIRTAIPREPQLNEWASEGWRLITIVREEKERSTTSTYAIYLERAASKT